MRQYWFHAQHNQVQIKQIMKMIEQKESIAKSKSSLYNPAEAAANIRSVAARLKSRSVRNQPVCHQRLAC